MNKSIFISTIFLSLFSNLLCFSQNTDNSSSWKLYKEITGLQIFSKDLSCNDNQNGIHEQYIVFQFMNTTSEAMMVSWQKELWYDDKCTTCNKPANNENTFSVTINPGESIEGSCSNTSIAGLKIFSGFINTVRGSHLTKFEFKNMTVSFK
jgi:hypothetical protein